MTMQHYILKLLLAVNLMQRCQMLDYYLRILLNLVN